MALGKELGKEATVAKMVAERVAMMKRGGR